MKLNLRSIVISSLTLACASAANAVTESDAESILFMKQEEKLARDVYNHLYSIYQSRVFSNIASAEQKHMDAVDYLIKTNNLSDLSPAEAGQFTYAELTELYNQLIEKGTLSLTDALEVGVLIEETDIADLEEHVAVSEDATLLSIYNNLLRGSYNHLRAFNNNLSSGASIEQPTLNQQGNGTGICLQSNTGGNGNQVTFQSKPANGKGPWKNVSGNAYGTNSNVGVEKVPNQINLEKPAQAMQYRARSSDGTHTSYSNSVCSTLTETPWPDAEMIGQGWFDTWMGELFIRDYPTVYSERFGSITINTFVNGELWFTDENGKSWMTTEERYPWVFDPETGEWY